MSDEPGTHLPVDSLEDDSWSRLRDWRGGLRFLATHRFVRFLAVGVLNTIFGYTIFAVFILLQLHYAVAGLLSTVCGILFNFKTTGTLVFQSSDLSLIFRFVGVYGITYVLGTGYLAITTALGVPVLVASAISLLPMAMVAYGLNKWWVFPSGAR
jgi:putative flippase GtrA